ncbi:MAG: alpha-amylase family glycosyl hydrolase [Myxococcota bacterium]
MMMLHASLLSTTPAMAQDMTQPRAELIYFAMVDRFSDGLLTDHPVMADDPTSWHGGDLVGVTERLDDLTALGVTTLWLSPVFSSRQVSYDGVGPYHGDWPQDLDHVEARFGGDAALDELSTRAREMGVSLVLDMVYNHVSHDSPLLTQRPDWFHPKQDVTDWDDPARVQTGWIDGLPDLNQGEDAVYHYLLGRSLYWARRAGVKGFSVGGMQNMSSDFLSRLSMDLHTTLGPDFWLVGENFQGNPALLAQRTQATGMNAMFDFPLYYAMVDVFCYGGHLGQLADVLSQDQRYPDPNQLVTFLDNPDLPRIAAECGGNRSKIEQALLFLYTARGIPALTYGTEWMMDGATAPATHADMIWPSEGDTPPLQDTLIALYGLRQTHLASEQIGTSVFVQLSKTLMAYARIMPNSHATIVFINTQGEWQSVSGRAWWADGGRLQASAVVPRGGRLTIKSSIDKPMPAVWRVPPNSIQAVFLSSDQAFPPWANMGAGLGAATAVLEARVDVPPGSRLVAVGSNEPMGDWDPSRALEMRPAGAVWTAQVVTSSRSILAWKMAMVHPDGTVEWEPRDNRYAMPRPNQTLRVRWGR